MSATTPLEPRRSALRAWLLGRVALATIVLGLAYSLFSQDAEVEQTETTLVIEAIVVFAISTSFVIATYLERGGSARFSASLLLVLDIALVSASVGVTGGAGSVLAVLYGAVIVAAATALGGTAAYLAGALSFVCYGTIGIGMAFSVLPHPSDQPTRLYVLPPNDLAFAMLSNTCAMALVAVFSNWLAVQLARTGGALARSETDVVRLAQRNEAIVRSLRAGVLTLDANGIVTSLNPAALELLQAEAAHVIGTSVTSHFPDVSSDSIESDSRAETIGRRADGGRFPAGYSLTRMNGVEDGSVESLLTFQDLTEIRRLEAVADDAAQLATLGRVAATLAHEIRNPLGSISGSVELVRENVGLPEEDKHLLSIVVREVDRIDQLVRDMLDVARRREPRFEASDLVALCNEVALLAPRTTGESGSVLVVAPDSLVVVFDPDMIRQVVWNLVKNAIQATRAASHVTIRLSAQDARGFEIVVDDDGPGLREDERDRIFDAFHSRRARGVGLGLALVRQIVTMHGGTVDASNHEGGGARFRVRIPLLERTDEPYSERESI